MAKLKPGKRAPESGQYKTVGPRGGSGPEITAIRGKTLPPANPGSTYKLVRRTKHKAKRRR